MWISAERRPESNLLHMIKPPKLNALDAQEKQLLALSLKAGLCLMNSVYTLCDFPRLSPIFWLSHRLQAYKYNYATCRAFKSLFMSSNCDSKTQLCSMLFFFKQSVVFLHPKSGNANGAWMLKITYDCADASSINQA